LLLLLELGLGVKIT